MEEILIREERKFMDTSELLCSTIVQLNRCMEKPVHNAKKIIKIGTELIRFGTSMSIMDFTYEYLKDDCDMMARHIPVLQLLGFDGSAGVFGDIIRMSNEYMIYKTNVEDARTLEDIGKKVNNLKSDIRKGITDIQIIPHIQELTTYFSKKYTGLYSDMWVSLKDIFSQTKMIIEKVCTKNFKSSVIFMNQEHIPYSNILESIGSDIRTLKCDIMLSYMVNIQDTIALCEFITNYMIYHKIDIKEFRNQITEILTDTFTKYPPGLSDVLDTYTYVKRWCENNGFIAEKVLRMFIPYAKGIYSVEIKETKYRDFDFHDQELMIYDSCISLCSDLILFKRKVVNYYDISIQGSLLACSYDTIKNYGVELSKIKKVSDLDYCINTADYMINFCEKFVLIKGTNVVAPYEETLDYWCSRLITSVEYHLIPDIISHKGFLFRIGKKIFEKEFKYPDNNKIIKFNSLFELCGCSDYVRSEYPKLKPIPRFGFGSFWL